MISNSSVNLLFNCTIKAQSPVRVAQIIHENGMADAFINLTTFVGGLLVWASPGWAGFFVD
ncbi:MAG: hypothetical protein JWQ71_3611 [Pedosphaera sp.]|nr:hypothetical protein [Pedosphaera sp.]